MCSSDLFALMQQTRAPDRKKEKETNTSHDESKRHIVLSGKRNIVGVDDKTDMSADYNKFDEIPPFTVKTDKHPVT